MMFKVEDEALILAWRRRCFQWRLIKVIVAVFAFGMALWALTPVATLGWNETTSLPGKVYAVAHMQRPNKGQLAAFYPPANPYYPREMWFTKIIVGVAGDVITHRGRTVLINGKEIGEAREQDSERRRALPMIEDGVIPEGYYFVWTPHPRSYDSRYADIGLVHEKRIIGRAYRLF